MLYSSSCNYASVDRYRLAAVTMLSRSAQKVQSSSRSTTPPIHSTANTMATSLHASALPRAAVRRWSNRIATSHATTSRNLAQHVDRGGYASQQQSANYSKLLRANSRLNIATGRRAFAALGVMRAGAVQPWTQSQRAFSATTLRGRDHHFDTLKFVQRLKAEGFTEEQAVAMMKVLGDVIEER